jgi:hypothetical protein
MAGEDVAFAPFATCRTREGCDKTNGLLLVAVLLLSRQLPTPSTRHAEIVPQVATVLDRAKFSKRRPCLHISCHLD